MKYGFYGFYGLCQDHEIEGEVREADQRVVLVAFGETAS